MEFIESLNGVQSRPPYSFPGVDLHGFLLPASLLKLQDWCDTFLNIDPRFDFRAISPTVLLCMAHYPRMIVDDFADIGFAIQNEFFLMFPVLRLDGDLISLPSELTWAVPFIGVTNPHSAIAGQTVVGFPKTVGDICLATELDGSFRGKVAMPGFVQTGPTQAESLQTIIEVRTLPPDSAASTSAVFPWVIPEFLDPSQLLPMLMDVEDLFDAIDQTLYSVTNLKQVRDAENTTEAEVQRLVRVGWKQGAATPLKRFAGATVTITDNEIVALRETLGFPSATMEALLAFQTVTDLSFSGCKNIT